MIPALAVTAGEPAGIGTEIIRRIWQNREKEAIPCFFVIAAPEQFNMAGLKTHPISDPEEAADIFPKALPVLPPSGVSFHPVSLGVPHSDNVPYIIASMEQGKKIAMTGKALALVTTPIHKAVMQKGGFDFPGHTEFLGKNSVMLLKSPELATVPLTVHHGLRQAIDLLDSALIVEKAEITYHALRQDFNIERPRLAICGLNPHAGEEGIFGDEEVRIITPALKILTDKNIIISGPYAADSLFTAEQRKLYDVVLCMYHDQALIPVKTLDFDRAVNVTLNLPFIRTSPDHGVGLNIAGTGVARCESFIEALKLGDFLGRNRRKK